MYANICYIYSPSSFGININLGGGGNGLSGFGDGLSDAIIKLINFDPLPLAFLNLIRLGCILHAVLSQSYS